MVKCVQLVGGCVIAQPRFLAVRFESLSLQRMNWANLGWACLLLPTFTNHRFKDVERLPHCHILIRQTLELVQITILYKMIHESCFLFRGNWSRCVIAGMAAVQTKAHKLVEAESNQSRVRNKLLDPVPIILPKVLLRKSYCWVCLPTFRIIDNFFVVSAFVYVG